MNRFMKEYLTNLNNKDENYNIIKKRILDKKRKNHKIRNIAAILVIILLLGTFSPQLYAKFRQDMKYKEYTRRNYVSGTGEIASAYSEQVNMDYVFQNDIGVKLDSFILTDDTFKVDISFKLPEEMRVDKKEGNNNEETHIGYYFGFAVYDEEKNCFSILNRLDKQIIESKYDNYIGFVYKELGINRDKALANSSSTTIIELDEDKVVARLEMNTLKGFPNSKKIYIRIFNIGYWVSNSNLDYVSDHSDLEWNFEIETPDKFLKRDTTNLVLLDEIPKLKINKFTVTETGMVFIAQKKDVIKVIESRKRYGKLWGSL